MKIKNMATTNALQNSYSLHLMNMALYLGKQWISDKIPSITDENLKNKTLNFVRNIEEVFEDAMNYNIRTTCDLYTYMFDSNKKNALPNIDPDSVEHVFSILDQINAKDDTVYKIESTNMIELFNSIGNMVESYNVQKMIEKDEEKFHKSGYSPASLIARNLVCRDMIREMSVFTFTNLRDFMIKDFGDEILNNNIHEYSLKDLSHGLLRFAKFVINEVPELMDMESKSFDLMQVVGKSVEEQLQPITNHIMRGTIVALSKEKRAEVENRFNINSISGNHADTVELIDELLEDGHWFTSLIIFPTMLFDNGTKQACLNLTTISTGYYDYDTTDMSIAMNMFRTIIDNEELHNSIATIYFVSNMLSIAMNEENTSELLLEAANKTADSYILNMIGYGMKKIAISLSDLVDRDDIPDDVREIIRRKLNVGDSDEEPTTDELDKMAEYIARMVHDQMIEEAEVIDTNDKDKDIKFN